MWAINAALSSASSTSSSRSISIGGRLLRAELVGDGSGEGEDELPGSLDESGGGPRWGDALGVCMVAKSIAELSERPRPSSSRASAKSDSSLPAWSRPAPSGSTRKSCSKSPKRSSGLVGEEVPERGEGREVAEERVGAGDEGNSMARAERNAASAPDAMGKRWIGGGTARCFARLRASFSPSSSLGTISKHLRLTHACFFMPGPPNFGLSAQL
mmetsp:Transcript_40453/g.81062  ORF Transcript_40453/g.81062 Transcript_40453/m.81062 type:complete len:214 (+) Transcript_40453:773-1414(+)